MLPDIGASELLVIAVVALIVVGPKDLPMLLRKLGQFMAKLRGMASEFRASFDEMARQSELDDLRKEVEAMRNGQLTDMAASASQGGTAFEEINQSLNDVGVQLHPPMSYQYEAAAEVAEMQPLSKAARKSRSRAGVVTPPEMAVAAKARSPKVTARKPATARAAPKAAARAKATPRKAPANPRKPTVERGS